MAMEKVELRPIAFHWIKEAIVNTKLSLATSLGITLFAFYSVRNVDTVFLSSLVTLDGILIAAMSFIVPFAIRLFKIEGVIDSLTKAMRKSASKPSITKEGSYIKGFLTFLSQIVPATVASTLMLLPAIGVVPYFCSAVLALLAMLKCGLFSVAAAIIAFQLTLWEFLMTLQLIWLVCKYYWETTMNSSIEEAKAHEKSNKNAQANSSNSPTKV